MSDPIEISRAADVDSGINQPVEEPIMYTGETFADCFADLVLSEDPQWMEELRKDVMFAKFWYEQQGKEATGKDHVRRVRNLYESCFKAMIRMVMELDEKGITSKQFGIDDI